MGRGETVERNILLAITTYFFLYILMDSGDTESGGEQGKQSTSVIVLLDLVVYVQAHCLQDK